MTRRAISGATGAAPTMNVFTWLQSSVSMPGRLASATRIGGTTNTVEMRRSTMSRSASAMSKRSMTTMVMPACTAPPISINP